jgi:hypothetical protein
MWATFDDNRPTTVRETRELAAAVDVTPACWRGYIHIQESSGAVQLKDN